MAGDRGGCRLISRRAFLAGALAAPGAALLASCSGGPPARVAVPEPRAVLRTRWSNDAFARGAVSYVPLGVDPAVRRALAAPLEGALFFAGEATSSTRPGTVVGALESGRRAASEVLATTPRTGAAIVVLGAGAAGLAAAAELRAAGFAPVVLEARDRIGGRVHTDESFGVAVDLGAAVVTDAGPGDPLTALARTAGVVLDQLPATGLLHDADGRRRPATSVDRLRTTAQDALAAVGAGTAADNELDAALRAELTRKNVREPELGYVLARLVEQRRGAPATELSWRGLTEGTGGAVPTATDALPRAGHAAVLAPLAAGLDVRLRTVVTRVDWSRARNRVITDAGEIPFDRLVVTLPLGVLQSGTPAFDPPLPAAMSAAVRTLGTGALDVLALRFDEPFWPRDATRLDFVGLTPGEWTSWVSLLPARGAPILVATNAALVARRFDAIDDAALTASALAVLRTMRS